MQGLIGPLKELAEFEELCKNKKKDAGMIRVCGCVNSQKSHMMYAIGDGCKYKVIACSSETKAKQIYEEYRFADKELLEDQIKTQFEETCQWLKDNTEK